MTNRHVVEDSDDWRTAVLQDLDERPVPEYRARLRGLAGGRHRLPCNRFGGPMVLGARVTNQVTVYTMMAGRPGVVLYSGRTRRFGNAVKDVCNAILDAAGVERSRGPAPPPKTGGIQTLPLHADSPALAKPRTRSRPWRLRSGSTDVVNRGNCRTANCVFPPIDVPSSDAYPAAGNPWRPLAQTRTSEHTPHIAADSNAPSRQSGTRSLPQQPIERTHARARPSGSTATILGAAICRRRTI